MRVIRGFHIRTNCGKYEFHLRGVKVAAVSVLEFDRVRLDRFADGLHNILHREIKFLNDHPEATLAPASAATPETMVASLEDLS